MSRFNLTSSASDKLPLGAQECLRTLGSGLASSITRHYVQVSSTRDSACVSVTWMLPRPLPFLPLAFPENLSPSLTHQQQLQLRSPAFCSVLAVCSLLSLCRRSRHRPCLSPFSCQTPMTQSSRTLTDFSEDVANESRQCS